MNSYRLTVARLLPHKAQPLFRLLSDPAAHLLAFDKAFRLASEQREKAAAGAPVSDFVVYVTPADSAAPLCRLLVSGGKISSIF